MQFWTVTTSTFATAVQVSRTIVGWSFGLSGSVTVLKVTVIRVTNTPVFLPIELLCRQTMNKIGLVAIGIGAALCWASLPKPSPASSVRAREGKLVAANGALLMKIPVAKSEPEESSKKEEAPKKINLKDAFDKNGNFLH